MRIICIHQSADLYGSDRSFLQVIKYLKYSCHFSQITILLPKPGPLTEELQKLDIEILYMKLSLLSKTFLKKLMWGKIIFPLFKLKSKHDLISSYDVVYVNTSVILDLYLLAPFIKKKKILHVREIPSFPLNKLLSFFISKGDFTVIFNSHSTKNAFKSFKKSYVIHNAFEEYSQLPYKPHERKKGNELQLLLIGRINNWKGQDFAIEALSQLEEHENVKLTIVGSTSQGNEILVYQLKARAYQLNLMDRLEFIDFVADPRPLYLSADVIIVPSKKPEPFGRIAIEAMSLRKPVIAANHGGLPEIISHEKNGLLFSPNNTLEFISCVRQYYYNRSLLEVHGKNSFKTFKEKFSIEVMHHNLDKVFKQQEKTLVPSQI